ncbi:MAG: CvpA family protein [Alphaproteobacteria bacterium]
MEFLTQYWFDMVAVVLIFLSVMFGFFRGFTREVLAIVAWLAAAVITDMAYDFTSNWVMENITQQTYIVAGISVIVVFLILLIIFMLLGGPLWRGIRRSSFWLIDSTLGLFFGLARGLLVLCILVVGLAHATTSQTRSQIAETSKLLPYADDGARQIIRLIKELPHERVQEDWFQDMLTDVENNMGPRLISTGLPRLNNSATGQDFSVKDSTPNNQTAQGLILHSI